MLRNTFKQHLWRGLLVLCFTSGASAAAEPEPLPQPLTLEHALSLVESKHPLIQQAQAEKLAAEARQQGVDAQDDFSVSLEARARWVMPPSSVGDDVLDDHKGSLFVRKSLYDFGRTGTQQQAARAESEAMAAAYRSRLAQHRINVMKAFFDVIYADQENFRDNEALAIAYIQLDRLRNRQELGQSSDIEVLELESFYQTVRAKVNLSSSRQRMERSKLANILNRPGDLPADVAMPEINIDGRKLPEYEWLLEQAEQNNPEIKRLELELAAAEERVNSARSGILPRLDAELETSHYEREMGSSDRWRAGVTLTVPIYNGERIDAEVAVAQAELMSSRSQLSQARQELRQAVLENWFLIQRLDIEREQAFSELDYRELYLDRSRTNYEMEVKADLGDAMVRLSDAQLALMKSEFDTVLAWEQLSALVGIDLDQPEEQAQ